MRVDSVEIYSDTTNAAVMRHPGRRFPGVLIQSDTLSSLVGRVKELTACVDPETETGIMGGELLDDLTHLLRHYETVLVQHGIELPYARR
jgi:hypothetical protein